MQYKFVLPRVTLLLACLSFIPVQASLITVNFSGVVDDALSHTALLGSAITGSYQYDDAVLIQPGDTLGEIPAVLGYDLVSLQFDLDIYHFDASINPFGYSYHGEAGQGVFTEGIGAWDEIVRASMGASQTLPDLDLIGAGDSLAEDFDIFCGATCTWDFDLLGFGGFTELSIGGTLTRSVPEPTVPMLFALGLFGFIAARGRKVMK